MGGGFDGVSEPFRRDWVARAELPDAAGDPALDVFVRLPQLRVAILLVEADAEHDAEEEGSVRRRSGRSRWPSPPVAAPAGSSTWTTSAAAMGARGRASGVARPAELRSPLDVRLERARGRDHDARVGADHGHERSKMIEQHYGALLDGAGAAIADRLDALEAVRRSARRHRRLVRPSRRLRCSVTPRPSS